MKNRSLIIVFIYTFLSICAYSQRQTKSAFTRYGYGDLFSNTTAYNQAMGGIAVGVCNPTQINLSNPASQARIKGETFLFNVGAGGNFRHATEGDASTTLSSVGLESFSLAFPIIPERWGCAVGVLPFNSVGYTMNYEDSVTSYSYKGDGGINHVMISTGVRLFKGFSLGANIGYLFGTTTYTGENEFQESAYFSSRKELEYKTIGVMWSLGLQYKWDITEDKSLTFGATFRNKQSLSYKENELFTSYIVSSYTEYAKDTAVQTSMKSDTDIPMDLSFGLSYSNMNKYMIGLDAGYQFWNDISCYGVTDANLKSTKFIRLGGEWIPDYRSSKFYKRIPIRFGCHYSDLPIVFEYNGETSQAKEWGISLGSRIKSKQTQNSMAIAMDFGARGNKNLAKSLHETYLLVKLNVTLQEVWFTKRKIN